MDRADELEHGPGLGRDRERDRFALVPRTGDAGVSWTIDLRRRVLADAPVEILKLGRRMATGTCTVRLPECRADRAIGDRSVGARQVLRGDDGEGMRTVVGSVVDD